VTCPFAQLDGAYVLGALSPAERLDFERHLPGCKDCTRAVRELAGLPGLLGRIDPELLEGGAEDPVPATLLPAVFQEVRRARRRRTFVTSASAAAAAVVIGLTPLGLSRLNDDPGSSPVATQPTQPTQPTQAAPAELTMQPVGDVPVRAQVALDRVTWGTRLDLTCTYDPTMVDYQLPPVVTYVLYVRTRDGHSEQVGTWKSFGGKTLQLSAATAANRGSIASVQVRTLDGRVVLQLAA
jgi:anti-sigma factor RsiW